MIFRIQEVHPNISQVYQLNDVEDEEVVFVVLQQNILLSFYFKNVIFSIKYE